MTDIVEAFGLDPASNTDVFVFITGFTFATVTVMWVVGLFRRNHSVMDAYYGFSYVIVTAMAFVISDAESQVAVLLLAMVALHGGRLGWYLAARMQRFIKAYGGDPRYNGFYERLQPGYWWKSFFVVMEPQAVLITALSLPAVIGILNSRSPDGQIDALAFAGLVVFGLGLYFESIADGQLQAFLAQEKRPRYLNTGVWKYSRHPNYFGTTTVWWGIWLVAISADASIWWTAIGPVINTLMLTVLTGSRMTDKTMGSRPDYQPIMARTRWFFPLPLSKQKRDAREAELAERE